MNRGLLLAEACRANGVAAAYLFGSRMSDGMLLLDGASVSGVGSDLDVGVFFLGGPNAKRLLALQVALDEILAPMQVDLVPLDHVDALFQFRAIDGYRFYHDDSTRADLFELTVMRRAAELLPIQRQIEREEFGAVTS